jgi:hypothetical protein
MADIYVALAEITNGLSDTMKECGFTVVVPEGAEKGELPAVTDSGRIIIRYKGENKALKIEHFNEKLTLYGASKEGDILDSDYSRLSASLLDEENCDAKGVRYVVSEFSETIVETFGTKAVKPLKTKLPPPVSKAQAKSGAVSYDPNTLGNRFTAVYPELRDEYKANCEKYGQFLPEEFFTKYGTPAVLETIKENNPQKMKKLFNLLNDIYEDGTNETQSLIVVTILGQMNNDQEMLAACVDYMSDDMMSPVINVNKLLGSGSGKSIKMRLANPPKYKPSKDKKNKKGVMNRLGM